MGRIGLVGREKRAGWTGCVKREGGQEPAANVVMLPSDSCLVLHRLSGCVRSRSPPSVGHAKRSLLIGTVR